MQVILLNSKPLFRTKKILTRLLVGKSRSVQDETEEILKKFLRLLQEDELKRIDSFEGEDIPKAPIIGAIIPDQIVFNTLIDTQMEKELVTVTDEQLVLLKVIPTSIDEDQTKKIETTQTDVVQTIVPPEKAEEKQKEEEPSVKTRKKNKRRKRHTGHLL